LLFIGLAALVGDKTSLGDWKWEIGDLFYIGLWGKSVLFPVEGMDDRFAKSSSSSFLFRVSTFEKSDLYWATSLFSGDLAYYYAGLFCFYFGFYCLSWIRGCFLLN